MEDPNNENHPKITPAAAALAGISIPIVEGVAAAAHGGFLGAVVALGASWGVYVLADELVKKGWKVSLPSLPERQERQPGEQSMLSRVFYGSHKEDDLEQEPGESVPPGTFTFTSLLESGWRPSRQSIFLARLDDGQDVFVSLDQVAHIAIAGATQFGKTSICRQLLSQFLSVGAQCILCDIHFTDYDVDRNEDWTPIARKLTRKYTSYDKIEGALGWLANTLLEERKKLRRNKQPVGEHVFIFIDELPSVIAKCPEVQAHLALLLREGAKFRIHLVLSSHDFLVKTVFPQSGSGLRDQLNTVLYVGGSDKTTVSALLNTSIEASVETTLGKGRIMVRAYTCQIASLARTPYMTNKAVSALLGPSSYDPNKTKPIAVRDTQDMPASEDATSESTSQASSVSPSGSTSAAPSETEQSEIERNGSRSETKGTEGASPLRQLSEREKQIGECFFERPAKIGEIIKEFYPDVKGGDAYQKATAEIQEAIRRYANYMRHRAIQAMREEREA